MITLPIICIENKIDYACKGRWYLTAHNDIQSFSPKLNSKKKSICFHPLLKFKLRNDLGIEKLNNEWYLIYDTYFGFIYKVNKIGMKIMDYLKEEKLTLNHLYKKILTKYTTLPRRKIIEFLKKLREFNLLITEETNKFPYLRVQWDITYRCNLSCEHCELLSSPSRKDLLTLKEMKCIVRKLSRISDFIDFRFSGGEPFASSNFLKILRFISKRIDCSISILTNGTLIDKQLVTQLEKIGKQRFKYIRVSISGGSAKINDFIRGEGSFNKIVTGIARLTKREFFVDVAFDCWKGNIVDIERVIKLAINLKCKRFGLSFIQPKGRAVRNFKKDDLYYFTSFELEKNYLN